MPGVLRHLDLLEQRGMITCFDTQDRVQTLGVQGLEGGGMRTPAVFGDHALAVWVVLPELAQEAFGSLAFTIIFGCAILRHNGFRQQRNPCTQGRMEQRRTSPLVIRSACPVAVDLGQTRGTVPRLGGKVRRAIECHSIVVIEQCHGFERLAALELPKDAREQGAA